MTGRKWREIIGSLQSMFTTLLIMPEGWNKLKVRKGREGKERKGKERKGKEREGKGREGKGRLTKMIIPNHNIIILQGKGNEMLIF